MKLVARSGLVVGFSLLAAACGRKGPLLYPDMLVPAAPAAVVAQQSGTAVKLQFSLPDKDLAGRSVQGVSGVKISRRVSEATQKDVCRSCTTDYLIFRTIYLDVLPADTQRFGSRLILLDSDVRAGNNYSYRIIPFTVDGVDGAASTVAGASVVAAIPAPAVQLESFPTEVKLQLTSRPVSAGQLSGYNVYRSSAATPWSYKPLNSEPLTVNEYVDTSLERGVKYRYNGRALVDFGSGVVVESAESESVEGMLKDDE